MRSLCGHLQGDLIVAGGIIGSGTHTASTIRLQPGADAWEDLAPVPLELAGHSLVVVAESSQAWQTFTDPRRTSRIGAASSAPHVHIVGGDLYGTFHRAIDTRDNHWVGFPQIPYPVEFPELVQWEGALWLIGGFMTAEGNGRLMLDAVKTLGLSEVGVPSPISTSEGPR